MRRRHVMTGLGLLCLPRLASANLPLITGRNVEISPIMLNLGGPGSTATCTVFNNGTAPTTSQIRLRRWTQVDGQDVLTDTNDVVASPPIMTIAPGAKQIVRVANLTAATGASELAYRMLLNELPEAGSLTNNGITVLVAFNLPVFIAGADAQPPQLTATFIQGVDGKPILRLHNDGDVHARLADISYTTKAGLIFKLPGLVGYVLPHSMRDIDLPNQQHLPSSGGVLTGQTQLQSSAMPIPLL